MQPGITRHSGDSSNQDWGMPIMQANVYPGRGQQPDWNDPTILQRDRLPARAYFIPFPDQASCRHALSDNRRYLSPYVITLSGSWDFRYYANILQLPENILSFRSGFETRQVPDAGQPIAFTANGPASGSASDPANGPTSGPASPNLSSQPFPFPINPPMAPQEQPVYVYRRTCRLPLLWSGLRKHLVLQGIRSACHVFANGRLAGYTQGSCLPAEFDMTNWLHDGDNELFLLVYPYCSGSYFERQSDSLPAGISGDVYLEAAPAIALHDLQISTTYKPEEEAWRLDLHIQLLSNRIALDQPVVRASLRQNDQNLQEGSWPVIMKPADRETYAPPVQTAGHLAVSLMAPAIEPWNDEQPNLYDLFVSIEDRGGRDLLCVHQAVGFRQLSTRDGRPMLNDKPLCLRAVSWQEPFEPLGQTADLGQLIRQLRQFKQQHLNAIYFRHNPPDPILLELCDIYGFYVIEEAPLAAVTPDILQAFTRLDPALPGRLASDRLERLIRRDANHPSVIMWSADLMTGMPSADLLCAYKTDLAAEIRRLDPLRWLHGLDIPDCAAHLDAWLSRRSGEYPSDLSWIRFPAAGETGGCLYDREQPISFLPVLQQLLRPLDIQPVDALSGAFVCHNRLTWTAASSYQISWQLLRQGKAVLSGELDGVRAEPGASQPFELWYGDHDFIDGADYVLRFEISQGEPCLWADIGDAVSRQEFHLAAADLPGPVSAGHTGGRLRLESDRHHLIVSGSRFWLVFNRINGALESWRAGDKELLAASVHPGSGYNPWQLQQPAGLRCCLNRRPEPADLPDLPFWQKSGYDRLWTQVQSIQDGCDGQTAMIDLIARLGAAGQPACFSLALRYEIHAAGDLRLFASIAPLAETAFSPPCFSLCLSLRKSYHLLSWYGSGPDRIQTRLPFSSCTGLYEQQAADLLRAGQQPGIFPDTRWLTLRDDSGFGLSFRSDHLFGFDLCPADAGFSLRKALELLPDNQPPTLQIIHPMSLGGHVLREPLKMTLIMKPVV